MGELSWWHWLIVVLVFVLLFGSKRLPDAARSLGRSMRIFKTEVKALHDDEQPQPTQATQPTQPAPQQANAALPPAAPAPAAPAPAQPTAAQPTAAQPTEATTPDPR